MQFGTIQSVTILRYRPYESHRMSDGLLQLMTNFTAWTFLVDQAVARAAALHE